MPPVYITRYFFVISERTLEIYGQSILATSPRCSPVTNFKVGGSGPSPDYVYICPNVEDIEATPAVSMRRQITL